MDYSALKDLCPFHQLETCVDCLVLKHGVSLAAESPAALNPLPEPNNLAEIILMSPNWELILADLTQWAYSKLKRQMLAYQSSDEERAVS